MTPKSLTLFLAGFFLIFDWVCFVFLTKRGRVTDGPYLDSTEHVGGFWVLQTADLTEALTWGRKAALACRAPVEVRPFH